jgi:hypothetical protein
MSKPDSYDLLLHENTEIEFLATTKQIYSMQEIDVQNLIGKNLTINRILGYKNEIQGS